MSAASIPHTSLPVPRARDLHVSGRRILSTEEEALRAQRGGGAPRPIAVSAPLQPAQQPHSHSRVVSRSASPPHAASRGGAPRWSPGGSEGRFGPEGNSSPDPAQFLRRGTGEWSHSMPQQPTDEELWQQQQQQHAMPASPPRALDARRGRGRSRIGVASRSHSASASSVSPHPFLRAHSGGHAHPDLPMHHPQQQSQQQGYDDIELELSGDVEVEEQQLQHDQSEEDSILQSLTAPPPQRYPFIRRTGTHEQQTSAAVAPPSVSSASASASAPLRPGSTIASLIQRFREQPPQSPSSRSAATASITMPWWMAATAAGGGSAAAATGPTGKPVVPALAFPKQQQPHAAGAAPMSTAAQLRAMEDELDSQRESKRQLKLQQLEQQLRAEQEQEEEAKQQEQEEAPLDASINNSHQQHQQQHDEPTLGASFGSSSDHDLSLLAGLDTSLLSPEQGGPSHEHQAVTSHRQPRQSTLDDSDDFSALLAPARSSATPARPVSSYAPPSAFARNGGGSGGSNSAVGDLASSQDVEDLLRKWRAERNAGAALLSFRAMPLSPLQPSHQPRPQSQSHRGIPASSYTSHRSTIAPSVAPFRASDENSAAATEVKQLIAVLKKRLGLSDSQLDEQSQQQSRVPLQPLSDQRANMMQQQHQHRSPTRGGVSKHFTSSSPQRIVSRAHGPLEDLLKRPGPAEQDYLDSARGKVASVASAAPAVEAHKQSTMPVIPPLKLPVQPFAAAAAEHASAAPNSPQHSTMRSSIGSATERMLLDASAAVEEEGAVDATRSPPRAREACAAHPDQPADEEEAKHSGAHATAAPHPAPIAAAHVPQPAVFNAAPAVAAASLPIPERFVPLAEFEALQRAHARELAKAECARLLRRELRKEQRSQAAVTASRKRRSKSRSRGVISIHITPVEPPAAAVSAPATAASSAPAPAAAPADQSSDEKKDGGASSEPAALSAATTVHYISNAPPTFATYSLPSTPARQRFPPGAIHFTPAKQQQQQASQHGDGIEDEDADAAGPAVVREMVTRGLFCGPDAYEALVQQLHPHLPAASSSIAAVVDHNAQSCAASREDEEERKAEEKAADAAGAAGTSQLSVSTAVQTSADLEEAQQHHHQQQQQQLQQDHSFADASTGMFSPSSAHLARLCAELGVTIAEYEADAPLRALVQQLDQLHRQQAHAQALQQRMAV